MFYPGKQRRIASARKPLLRLASVQPSLIEVGKLSSGFRDPAFNRNRELPVHRWVPWVAGFSAEFVEDCLVRYLPASQRSARRCVLDPFAGVGTTLAQGLLHGCEVVGFEINPYAALAARTKVKAFEINPGEFQLAINAFESFMTQTANSGKPRAVAPAGFSGRTQLFSPKVERKVLFVLDFICSLEQTKIRDLFRLALGSVMVSFSNYSYEPSLTRRAAVGKSAIDDAEVGRIVSGKLRLMLEDIQLMRNSAKQCKRTRPAAVYNQSIFTAREHLRRGSVDLVITSPPYLNNYHYPRNTRPQVHWHASAD